MPARKKSSTTKKSEPVVELSVEVNEPEPVQVQEPVNTDNSEVVNQDVVEVDEILQLYSSMQEKVQNIQSMVKELSKDMVHFEKLHNKERKRKVKRTPNPNRKPSGFAKPSLISDDLCKFMSKPPVPSGSLLARTEVTKFITGYIKDHNLQDPSFKRRILPDNKLKKLLGVKKNDELTYFNLQKYMKHHFPKPVEQQS